MRQVRGLDPVVASQERVHRAALDRAGPDQRHLDDEIVEGRRAKPGQDGHLRPGLDLEHPHGVGRADHLVDGRVLWRDRAERPLVAVERGDQVETVVQRGQHAQPEQVELDQPGVRAVIFVPLENAAAGHPRPLDRAHLAHRAVADHHAAGMDAQVPRQPLQLPGEFGHGRGNDRAGRARVAGQRLPRHRGARPDLPHPLVRVGRLVAERPPGVAQREPGPVGDHVGHLRCPVPAVPLVDVLDDFFAPTVLDVEIDVRRTVPAFGKKPLEQQPVPDRIHVRDADRVADRRISRRPPPLAQDPLGRAEPHDVVHDQEVARKAEPLDHVELPRYLRERARHGLRVWAAVPPGLGHQGAQPGRLGVSGRHGEVGQVRRDDAEVERALKREGHRPVEDPRITSEQRRHLGARPQVRGASAGQPAVDLVQAAPRPDRGERGGEPRVSGCRVVHVAGRDHAQAERACEGVERVVPLVVTRVVTAGELHEYVVPPEHAGQRSQLGRRRLLAAGGQCRPHRSLAAPGEHRPLPAVLLRQRWQVVRRGALLTARQLGAADHRTQPPVSPGPPRQHEQVPAVRVRRAALALLAALAWAERELGAEDGAQPGVSRRGLCELRHAVHAVVIGDRERREPEPGGLGDQLGRGRRAVEEAVRRVAVQLRPGRTAAHQ